MSGSNGLPVVDVHMHMLGYKLPNYASLDQMRHFRERKFGFFADPDFDPSSIRDYESEYVDSVAQLLGESQYVDKGVLLAMDVPVGVERQWYVDNKFVAEQVARYPNELLVGASVNPARKNALDEVERCLDLGAVVFKLIPNSQQLDLWSREFFPFWDGFARFEVPLLVHTGNQHTVLGANQSYGNPGSLTNAAKAGVRLILAHCGSPGQGLYTTCAMIEKHPNVYGELSAMGRPLRYEALSTLSAMVEQKKEWGEKLVYGTDHPLKCKPSLFVGKLDQGKRASLSSIENPFDRYVMLLKELGFPDEVFTRGAELLRLS